MNLYKLNILNHEAGYIQSNFSQSMPKPKSVVAILSHNYMSVMLLLCRRAKVAAGQRLLHYPPL